MAKYKNKGCRVASRCPVCKEWWNKKYPTYMRKPVQITQLCPTCEADPRKIMTWATAEGFMSDGPVRIETTKGGH